MRPSIRASAIALAAMLPIAEAATAQTGRPGR